MFQHDYKFVLDRGRRSCTLTIQVGSGGLRPVRNKSEGADDDGSCGIGRRTLSSIAYLFYNSHFTAFVIHSTCSFASPSLLPLPLFLYNTISVYITVILQPVPVSLSVRTTPKNKNHGPSGQRTGAAPPVWLLSSSHHTKYHHKCSAPHPLIIIINT